MRYFSTLPILVMALCLAAYPSTPISPKTTLAAETANNTSTANTFIAQTNGNAGAGNVSKVPIRTLLYSGSNTKIYAHWMPWFGTTSHMNVGYDSASPTQVSLQVSDMASRGIDGAVVDWYGPNNTHHNTATINLMNSSQATGGKFSFAIMEDVGALNACANTSGCDVTAQAISDLTYAYNTFEVSPAYVRIGGRPVVFFFGTEKYALDWTRIRTNTPGNPLFIFRNSGGFTVAQSNGGFSWIGLSSDPTNMGLGYLDYFDSTAMRYPASATFASGYKGFNDTLAAWGSNRILNQQCGQTWLATLAESGKYYSATNQLASIQLVTWNDYEEGSEIETGIDNCVSISGSSAGNSVSWSITGQENTVDHYTVFISLDGQNLMPVADVAAGTHTLDLSQFSFDPANYTLYVKAVGKPTLTNKMSGPIAWTLMDVAPVAKLSVTPTSGIAPVTVNADTSASTAVNGTISSVAIDFGDGTVLSGPAASHTYSSPGTYPVIATVTDSFGGIAKASSTVTLAANQPPLPRLTISPFSGIAPVTVNADASASTDPDGNVASTKINFGDGTIANAATASHSYSTPGTYTVTATVTDNLGASSTATATATIAANQPPVARLSVTPTSGVAPVTVTADASASTDADGKIASVVIDFGDGTLSTAMTASHTYSKAGTYTVTATVTDDRGAGSTAAKTVTASAPVNKPPAVSIAVLATSVIAGAPVFTQVTASDSDGTIAAVSINWGDGSALASTTSASHIYKKAGFYTITVTATDNLGAKTSATASVTVNWGVVVTSPVPGGTYGSPVHVVAKASSSVQITCIKIYLDNVAVYSISGVSQIDTYVKMATGSHRVVVQAWDANGVVYKNIQYITLK